MKRKKLLFTINIYDFVYTAMSRIFRFSIILVSRSFTLHIRRRIIGKCIHEYFTPTISSWVIIYIIGNNRMTRASPRCSRGKKIIPSLQNIYTYTIRNEQIGALFVFAPYALRNTCLRIFVYDYIRTKNLHFLRTWKTRIGIYYIYISLLNI